MTRTVFDNSMVAHVWAAQTQREGRSSNGNLFFRGPDLFSYGSHFVVGRIMPDGVALLNSKTYSISTSRHQSEAAGAVRHLTSYRVPELTDLLRKLDSVSAPRVYDEAARQYRDRAPSEVFSARVAAVHPFIRDNEGLSENAALYLLSSPHICGDKRAAATLARLYREREAAKAKAKASAEREAKANAAELAKRYGRDMSPKAFSAALRDAVDSSYRRLHHGGRPSFAGRICELTSELATAHKAAKSAKAKKLIWSRVLAVREAKANWAVRTHVIARRKDLRTAVWYTRQAIQSLLQHGASEWTPLTLELAARAFETVAHNPMIRAAGRAHLSDLANSARTILEVRRAREREQAAEREAAARERRARENALRAEREAAARVAWFAGDTSVSWRGSDESGRAYIRAVDVRREDGAITGGRLETSHGADVPLPHAVKAFRFIKLCRESGRPWHRNGRTIRVGHFQIDSIDPHGNFRAGCHSIGWSEVERVARELGVFDMPADESAMMETELA